MNCSEFSLSSGYKLFLFYLYFRFLSFLYLKMEKNKWKIYRLNKYREIGWYFTGYDFRSFFSLVYCCDWAVFKRSANFKADVKNTVNKAYSNKTNKGKEKWKVFQF